MAISLIDRKILADLINHCATDNEILLENLRRILGISLMLEGKLSRARRLCVIDISREIRSLALYQEIIFLAKEGLALTEVFIMPFCGADADAEYHVMTYKLRASFHHIFCLYHNTPPVRQLRQKKMEEPTVIGTHYMTSRGEQDFNLSAKKVPSFEWSARKERNHRLNASPAPSVQSFVTNPYAGNEQAAPVLAHVPGYVLPQFTIQSRTAPTRPPGLGMNTVVDYDPPVSASTFMMPPLDYTPETKRLFERATKRAEARLHAAHPLVLAIALEHATFLMDCLGDYDRSFKVVKRAARAAYLDKDTSRHSWVDTIKIMHEMTAIVVRAEQVLQPENRLIKPEQVNSPPLYPPPTRELPIPPHQRNGADRVDRSLRQHNASTRSDSAHGRAARVDKFPSPPRPAPLSLPGGVTLSPYGKQVQSLGVLQSHTTENSPENEGNVNDAATISATLVESPTSPMTLDSKIKQINEILAHKKSKRSRSAGSSLKSKSSGRRMEGTGTEKERKRRALERAEDELLRKRDIAKKADAAVHYH